MSKAIKIGINFLTDFSDTVTKLRVNELGASTTNWVPEDEVQADALHVTANGEYSAATAGKYCYDYVTVSVPGNVVTGKDPTTGKEVSVTVDPETGELVEEVLPVEIRVTTPPTLVQYTDGDTIDFTGIVVHAYDSDGEDLGAVPFGELVFPVTEASVSHVEAWTDEAGLNAKSIYYQQTWTRYVDQWGQETEEARYVHTPQLGERAIEGVGTLPATYGGNGPASLLFTRYNGNNYAAVVAAQGDYEKADLFSQFSGPAGGYGGRDGLIYGWHVTGGSSASISDDGLFHPVGFEEYLTDLPESTVDPEGKSISGLKGIQSVPVQWPRTVDGAVLESSFNIYVTPAP